MKATKNGRFCFLRCCSLPYVYAAAARLNREELSGSDTTSPPIILLTLDLLHLQSTSMSS